MNVLVLVFSNVALMNTIDHVQPIMNDVVHGA